MVQTVNWWLAEYSRTGNDLKIKFVSNTKRKIALGDLLSFDWRYKSKIENNTAQKSIDVLSRKEKTCEKLNFSPVIKITSNAIPKY